MVKIRAVTRRSVEGVSELDCAGDKLFYGSENSEGNRTISPFEFMLPSVSESSAAIRKSKENLSTRVRSGIS